MLCSSAPFNIIGTDSALDLSDYSELHVVAKGTVAYNGSCAKFGTSSSFNIANYTSESYVTTAGVTDDYMVNISGISSGYIYITCTDARAAEIYEIYLVPKQRKYIIKDGILQDGFSLSATNYNISYDNSTFSCTIKYNDGYISIYSVFNESWQTSGSIFLDNQLSSVIAGTMVYVEAVTSYTNFDSRYPNVGVVAFAQVNKKANKFTTSSRSNFISNTQGQKTLYSFQCTNTSKYFVFPVLQICAKTSNNATCTIDIYNAWFY